MDSGVLRLALSALVLLALVMVAQWLPRRSHARLKHSGKPYDHSPYFAFVWFNAVEWIICVGALAAWMVLTFWLASDAWPSLG